jgi:hypothetical protein
MVHPRQKVKIEKLASCSYVGIPYSHSIVAGGLLLMS